MEGENDLSENSDKMGVEIGLEGSQVSSKEIVVHTNVGPTLTVASLWPCLQCPVKCSTTEMRFPLGHDTEVSQKLYIYKTHSKKGSLLGFNFLLARLLVGMILSYLNQGSTLI